MWVKMDKTFPVFILKITKLQFMARFVYLFFQIQTTPAPIHQYPQASTSNTHIHTHIHIATHVTDRNTHKLALTILPDALNKSKCASVWARSSSVLLLLLLLLLHLQYI